MLLQAFQRLIVFKGPLAKAVGDTLSRYVELRNSIGSSESCIFPTYTTDPEDWQYMHFNPELEGFQFRHVDDNLYELVIVRHPSTDAYHSTWYTFPDQDEYATHDLYAKHPSKDGLWLCVGRADDIIVLSNGEKLKPVSMEIEMLSHPEVAGAVVLGQARFEPVALVELRHRDFTSEEKREAFLQSFYTYIDKANETVPSYGRLLYDHVMFTQPDKPMIRADKGTVKRSATLMAYATEIDDFYKHLELSNASTGIELNMENHESLTASLTKMIQGIGGFKDMTVDDDFFVRGMNSLQVMTWVRQIKSSIAVLHSEVAKDIAPKLIYSNPTVKKLADAIFNLVNPTLKGHEDAGSDHITAMKKMVEQFSSDLPVFNTQKPLLKDGALTILLTGTTGVLGSYMLDHALSMPNVKKIICLNRKADSEAQQRSSHASRGLVTDWQDRVLFFQADLSKPRLGLHDEQYNLVRNDTSLIIRKRLILQLLPALH